MAEQTVSINKLYNGAIKYGNGGYNCGLLANFINGDCEVRIDRNFPVETPLTIKTSGEGVVEAYLEGKLLGSARPTSLQLDVPAPPGLETARRAAENFIFLHAADPVRGCYVCSPLRAPGKGLRLFIGPIGPLEDLTKKPAGENLVASVWRPTSDLADSEGHIDSIYIWSALDCPGVYALKLLNPNAGILVLGSCTASIKRPLPADQIYIVTCWQISPPVGRKLHMGVAIHSTSGELMACARQVCFDVGSTLPAPPK